jgi:hypothetical protein
LGDKRWEDSQTKKERKIKKRPPEKDPEIELKGPVPPLGKEIPGGMEDGRDENEKNAKRGQGFTNPFGFLRK